MIKKNDDDDDNNNNSNNNFRKALVSLLTVTIFKSKYIYASSPLKLSKASIKLTLFL
jgi:glucose uptake protein GlcU